MMEDNLTSSSVPNLTTSLEWDPYLDDEFEREIHNKRDRSDDEGSEHETKQRRTWTPTSTRTTTATPSPRTSSPKERTPTRKRPQEDMVSPTGRKAARVKPFIPAIKKIIPIESERHLRELRSLRPHTPYFMTGGKRKPEGPMSPSSISKKTKENK